MVQIREKTTLGRPPVPTVERPSRFFRWMGWLLGFIIVAGAAGLTWWILAEPTAEDAVVVEDFTGVDEFVAERVAAGVVPTPLQENFTGVDAQASAVIDANEGETPFQEDFTGVDEFVASRIAAGVVETPFQEDFTGLK